MRRVERCSELSAAAAEVWERAVTLEGVNDELRPLARMTTPARLRGRTLDELPVGAAVGRSWILLGGLLPVDYDDLRLVEVDSPRRFLERSRTAAFAVWEHERIVEPAEDGCTVTDRLGFALKPVPARIPGAAALARAIVGLLFGHRHRRLRRRYGTPTGPPSVDRS